MLRETTQDGGWMCLNLKVSKTDYKRPNSLTGIYTTHLNVFYYIPINILSLDTVDFTECDPMRRITTLWFSESISPLSETDDVVHNVFMRYCDVVHIAPDKICTKYYEAYTSYS